jgi:hypothetical protein
MAIGKVQRGEIVVVGLDIRTFGDGEAHVGEDRGDLVDDLGDRVDAAALGRRRAHWQADIDGFARQPFGDGGVPSSVLRAAMASATRALRPLIAGPACWRSSGVILPRPLSSSDTEPFLPSAATRTASMAASSALAAISSMMEVSRVWYWLMVFDYLYLADRI